MPLLLLGCSVAPNESPGQDLRRIEIEKSATVSLKIIKGAGNVILGYLEETENIIRSRGSISGDEMRLIFYVYNKDFSKVGFMTERGTVSLYQYTPSGDVVQISSGAIYTIDAGTRRLLSHDGPIYYDDFDPAPIWR